MAKQTFTTGQVLTAAQVNALQTNDFNQTVSAKTASYVLVAADKGTRIEFSTSGSVTCTVNTGLFDAGDTVYIQNTGAGVVTITAGTATVNTSATLAVNQYEGGVLYFVSASSAIWFEYASTATGDITGITTGATSGLTGGVTSGTADLKFNTTAKGALLVGTGAGTVTELTVGTNNTILTADSTTASGLKWAAASSSAMVFISAASFSSVSSVSFPTNTFTSTYDIYKVFFQFNASSSSTAVQLRMRNSGTDVTSGNYFYGGMGTDYNSSTTTYLNGSAVTAWNIRANTNIDRTLWELTVCNPQNSSYNGNCWITGMGDLMGTYSSGLWQNAVSTFDSMSIIKSTSGTFSGKYAIYGIVKS